jgi:Domain of unknown function (DUF4279)
MNSNRYQIDLSINHPSIDPAKITSALKLQPDQTRIAGAERMSRGGQSLGGHWSYSTWAKKLFEGAWPDIPLSTSLRTTLSQLAPHAGFLLQIHAEGGSSLLSVGWFFDGISGDKFDVDLLTRFSELGIGLELHIYTPDDTIASS